MFSLSISLVSGYLLLIICSVIITSGIRLQAVVNLTNGGPQADFTGKSISLLNVLHSMRGTNEVNSPHSRMLDLDYCRIIHRYHLCMPTNDETSSRHVIRRCNESGA